MHQIVGSMCRRDRGAPVHSHGARLRTQGSQRRLSNQDTFDLNEDRPSVSYQSWSVPGVRNSERVCP